MQINMFEGMLILMGTSLMMTIIAQIFKMPSTVGFILAGILLGPHMIKIAPSTFNIQQLSEFGLVFLMFTIGLEFSWSKLITMKREVFGFGGLQVICTILFVTVIGMCLKMSLTESLVVGAVVGMSSTAVVLKQLREQSELRYHYGQTTFSILLFQDLAVIPLLILIAGLPSATFHAFLTIGGVALLKAILAILLILGIGRFVLKPLYDHVSKFSSNELFTILTVFIALSAAWLTSQLGLSLTLGAFISGLMLSETEHIQKIESDIRPIRNVLMGLFFISIGMQFNIQVMSYAWSWMLLLLFALIIFKTTLIFLLGLFFMKSKADALKTGLSLANGGEFGFAILILALKQQLIPEDYGQVILGAILLSMALAPLIIKYNTQLIKPFELR
ncbi:MAG: cation:proton antiporter [Gammaproteobacteria bacterium]